MNTETQANTETQKKPLANNYPATDSIDLCYQELVEGYYRNLNDTLRNFRGGPGFLENWVHDENHSRSILEICDLALSHNIPLVKIRLQTEVANTLDFSWLNTELKKLGTYDIEAGPQETVFYFYAGFMKKSEGSPISPNVSETYLRKLEEASGNISHEASTKSPPNHGHEYCAIDEGRILRCVVDDSGIVISATHLGAAGLYRPLLDRLCQILESRPIQEGAEHGVIRLENSLRDESQMRKEQGIITPKNADPIFGTCLHLVRTIFQNYLSHTKRKVERNVWRDRLPESWLNTPLEERRTTIENELQAMCQTKHLEEIEVHVIEVKHEKRFVLAYQKTPTTQRDFAHALIGLERQLRELHSVELELQLESLEDKNSREQRTKRPSIATV